MKLLGYVSAFVKGYQRTTGAGPIFDRLKKQGLQEIWLCDEELRREFGSHPLLKPFKKYFVVVS